MPSTLTRRHRSGSQLEVLPELDVGTGRCGVRTKEELLPIAERMAALRT